MDNRMRSLSPLKSPTLQRHLRENINITYPDELSHKKCCYKQLLIGKDGYFRACISVQDFEPNEVQVKQVGHTILVSAKHEEKEDEFGVIERNFNKKYILPLDLDPEKVTSWISNGILYVKVPPKDEMCLMNERVVEIKLESK